MAVACGVLKKFDSFIFNCYSHLNNFDNKHNLDIHLLKVRDFYFIYFLILKYKFLFQKIDDVESEILNNLADNFNTSKVLNLLIELINMFNKSLTMVVFNLFMLFKFLITLL